MLINCDVVCRGNVQHRHCCQVGPSFSALSCISNDALCVPNLVIECPLVPPSRLVQAEADATERKEDREVAEREGLCLKDRLQRREVDEKELSDERDRDCEDEHPVLSQTAAQATVLDRRDQIQKDEGREGLKRRA